MNKVWIMNHYAAPPSLATGLRHFNFAKYLIRAGYEVTIFAASMIHNGNKNLIEKSGPLYITDESEGVPFVFIKTRWYKGNGKDRVLNMLDFFRRIFRVVKDFEKPDVIIASSAHPFTCVAGIMIAKKLRIPCICEIRDLWPESIVAYTGMSKKNLAIQALYKMEKWIYKRADRIIFTMPAGKQYIYDRGWDDAIDMEKIYHINNGVDLEGFHNNTRAWTVKDDDLEDKRTFKAVYTGSIRKVNNIGLLVDVAKELRQLGSRCKLLIWGAGDEEPLVRERARLEELDNIVLKGYADKKYIPSILSKADVNILHWNATYIMKYGMSANKLFEYLASGKPILSDLVVPCDIIEGMKCGITVKTTDPQTIARTILELDNCSEESYAAYCRNAQAAAQKYDFQNLTNELINIVEGLKKS